MPRIREKEPCPVVCRDLARIGIGLLSGSNRERRMSVDQRRLCDKTHVKNGGPECIDGSTKPDDSKAGTHMVSQDLGSSPDGSVKGASVVLMVPV